MKTKDIISLPEAKVAPALKAMKIKDLERHARKILAKLGQEDFDHLLRDLIKALPGYAQGDAQQTQAAVLQHVEASLPEGWQAQPINETPAADVAQRLSVTMMLLISKKFEKIHKENNV